jgi:hypothetical protein
MPRELIRFDWAIKKILRQRANFNILEGFLSELFKFDVKIQEILESESNKDSEEDKQNRVDILAKTDDDELILVEVQNQSETDYFQRMLYGTSRLVTQHISRGQPYRHIKKIYSVNIVYFDLGQGDDYIYEGRTEFKGMHNEDTLGPSGYQKTTFKRTSVSDIFATYYLLKVNNFDEVAKDTLDEWIYFLKNSEIQSDFKAKGLREAEEQLRYEDLSDVEKRHYDRLIENKVIEADVLETALGEGHYKGWEKGLKKGMEKGIEKGMEKGIEKGREEGVQQGMLEAAKRFLAAGLSPEEVARNLNLPLAQVKALKDE